MAFEHPFAAYIKILCSKSGLGHSLTLEEARQAMNDITCYEVEPQQVAAFLMLIRAKRETPEELAGFAQALGASIPRPSDPAPVAVNWPAYAGKGRQPPWFILAALLLGRNGCPVFMHGLSWGDEKIYAAEALTALGVQPSSMLSQAASGIRSRGFAYMPIQHISTVVQELIDYRKLLGLRTPAHSIARMLNPFSAPLMLQGVRHAHFAPIHQQAASLLGQEKSLAIRGDGGEFERIPTEPCRLHGLDNGGCWEEEWPPMLACGPEKTTGRPDLNHFRAVWEGREQDEYAEAAVTGTLALVLRALGRAGGHEDAHRLAGQWWRARHTEPAAK